MKQVMCAMAMIATMAFAGCKNGALDFNNKVVEMQQKLEPKLTAVSNKMQAAGGLDGLKSIVPDIKDAMTDVNKTIADLKALETPKNGEEFKKAMLDEYNFVNVIYDKSIKMAETTNEEERLKIATELMTVETEARRLEENTKKAQKAFADKSGFKMEKQ